MDAGQIIAVATALGLGGILGKFIDFLTERHRGKRDKNRAAWDVADEESSKRRLIEEYAHTLRRRLFKRGAVEGPGEDDVPPWPTYPKEHP